MCEGSRRLLAAGWAPDALVPSAWNHPSEVRRPGHPAAVMPLAEALRVQRLAEDIATLEHASTLGTGGYYLDVQRMLGPPRRGGRLVLSVAGALRRTGQAHASSSSPTASQDPPGSSRVRT